ncbi:MAG: hypothetical protein V2B19_18150 [Pseudomonadota bacterium]
MLQGAPITNDRGYLLCRSAQYESVFSGFWDSRRRRYLTGQILPVLPHCSPKPLDGLANFHAGLLPEQQILTCDLNPVSLIQAHFNIIKHHPLHVIGVLIRQRQLCVKRHFCRLKAFYAAFFELYFFVFQIVSKILGME